MEQPKSAFYVLKKDTIYDMRFTLGAKAWVLRAGEVCEYFSHSDTFLFESRDGVVPFFDREIVESLPEFFEPCEAIVRGNKLVSLAEDKKAKKTRAKEKQYRDFLER